MNITQHNIIVKEILLYVKHLQIISEGKGNIDLEIDDLDVKITDLELKLNAISPPTAAPEGATPEVKAPEPTPQQTIRAPEPAPESAPPTKVKPPHIDDKRKFAEE